MFSTPFSVRNLQSDFDRPLGESTGAGVIFGTTGGVIEAAVRTAYEIQTKKTLPKLDFTELRGLAGIRSATIDFDGVPVKIGIAHGLGNARRLVEEIRAGRSPYHAIEIMACPGGCINGGSNCWEISSAICMRNLYGRVIILFFFPSLYMNTV